jgi:glycosyltransferase involved in cell wall biosynthesis
VSRVSAVVPVFNEEELVDELMNRMFAVLDGLPHGPHELVVVDDGSTDGTPRLLDERAAGESRLRVVHLSRNFGHQAALTAGLDHARGDWIAVLDGDLQDPPEAVPALLAKAAEGYDVVFARRVLRKESWLLRLCYTLSYRMIAALSSTPIPLDAGDFAVMSRRVVAAMRAAPEHQPYLRGLRAWTGFRQIGLDVERHERRRGTSKYSFGKLLQLLFDGLFGFSVAPLRAAAVCGCGTIVVSGLYLAYALAVRLFLDQPPRGFTSLIAAIVFLAGVQLVFLGLIGEYVGRVFEQVKGRAVYVVDRVVGGGAG